MVLGSYVQSVILLPTCSNHDSCGFFASECLLMHLEGKNLLSLLPRFAIS